MGAGGSFSLRAADSATAIHDWLLSPQHELQQQTPVEALRKQRLPDVLQAANALEHVAYA